jgi:electron transport complex protein RnfE
VLKAYFPDLSRAMGVFIPLIVVNCIIMGRVESFASKRPLSNVIPDALGMGLGYTWVLVAISLIRELLGNGTILGRQIMPDTYTPILFFVLSPGGFFVFACVMAFGLFLKSRLKKASEE